MPRLPFWGFSAAATAGVSYTGYRYIFEPRQAAQHGEEARLSQSKQQYQDVIHAYARLRTRLEEQISSDAAAFSSSSSSSSSLSGSQRESSAAWFTNAEKILFFCDVQLVRRLLWTLPRRLTTEKDLHRMFSELTQWERQHCTELHFREKPLLFTQTLQSMACYFVYVLLFRVVDPLLDLCGSLADVQAKLRHEAARFITKTLDINVVMVLGEKPFEKRASSPPLSTGEEAEAREESASVQAAAEVQYVALSTSHWIEEVGFWACANNPLLTQHRQNGKDAPLCLLRGSSISAPVPVQRLGGEGKESAPRPWHRVSWCTPFCSASALTTTYAQHWCRVAREAMMTERRDAALTSPSSASSLPSLLDVAAEEVSLGYPVLTDASLASTSWAASGAPGAAARYLPVGVSGLPHLLYVDASHAVADARKRRTRGEVYALRQQVQYLRSPASEEVKRDEADASGPAASLSELQKWRAQGGPSWWRRLWWGGVYGGSRTSAAGPSYTLRYHVGAPCTAAAYVTEAIEASRAAESLACCGL